MPTAVVTGAARGIGRAIAEALRDAGYDVVGTCRLGTPADAPPGIRFLPLELGDPGSIDALAAAGAPDLLVNNAGYSLIGQVDETPWEEIAALTAVTWTGTARLTRAMLPGMRRRGSGTIVSIGSLQARIPLPYCAAYAASKAALAAFSRALRIELAATGIAVAVVHPGFVRTRIRQDAFLAEASSHAGRLTTVRAFRDRGIADGLPAAAVADTVLRILRSPRPRAVYLVGAKARLFDRLRLILPEAAFDALYRRALGL